MQNFQSKFLWKTLNFQMQPNSQKSKHSWESLSRILRLCFQELQKGICLHIHSLRVNQMENSSRIRYPRCLSLLHLVKRGSYGVWKLITQGWKILVRAWTDMEYDPDWDKAKETSAYPEVFWEDWNFRQPFNNAGEHKTTVNERGYPNTLWSTTLPQESRPRIENV